MANTPFLNLFKPTDQDQALVTDINSNMDKIDAGVSTLSDQIGTVKGKVDLGDLATQAAIESALDTKLNTLGNFERMVVQFRYTGTTDIFRGTFRYSCTLIRGGSASFAGAECVANSGSLSNITGARGSSGWLWDTIALKSQIPIDQPVYNRFSVSAASSMSFTISAATRARITIFGNATNLMAETLLYSSGSGTLRLKNVVTGGSVTVAIDGNKITITNADTGTSAIVIFEIYEGGVSQVV